MALDARQVVLASDNATDQPTTGAGIRALRLGFRVLSRTAPSVAARAAQRFWFTPPRPKIRADARAFLSTGERLSLVVNGRPVVAWRWGTGPAVILMHGWGGYGAQMQAFVEPLTRAGFQALTFDAPAHGESGPSRLGSRRSTLFDFADVLLEIARETSNISGVVAHSGGCTAAAWALRSAKLRVPAMVFVAPMASPITYKRIFQRALGLSDDVMRRFTENTEREFGFSWQELEVPEMAGRMKMPPPPVLVLHDRDDVETSWKEGAAIVQAWPKAQLHTTSGLGHRRILRDPAVIEMAVEFLLLSQMT